MGRGRIFSPPSARESDCIKSVYDRQKRTYEAGREATNRKPSARQAYLLQILLQMRSQVNPNYSASTHILVILHAKLLKRLGVTSHRSNHHKIRSSIFRCNIWHLIIARVGIHDTNRISLV